MDYTSDKRGDERKMIEHDVRLLFTRDCATAMTGKVTGIGRIMNQSRGGFCILTPFYIKQGDILRAMTDLTEDSEYYFDVRWVYPLEKGYMFGCSITNLS